MKYKRVSVIGLGYIGLPTAAMFASRKLSVVGVDVDLTTVDIVNSGGVHIVEPDLDMLVHASVHEGYLHASLDAVPADAFIMAVPTPFKEGFQPDLSYIYSACQSVAKVLEPGNLVVLESTSPVGTTDQISRWLAELRPDLTFPHHDGEASSIRIAYCPERVLPGRIIRELVENDRVIGGITPVCAQRAKELYSVFVRGECLLVDAKTAEMCKLVENSFRDVNIAFANEVSLLCDKFGVDVWSLISLANRHPRVQILNPGPGVGGHCIAVDPWFLISGAPDQSPLLRTARQINTYKPEWVLAKIREAVLEVARSQGKTTSEVSVGCFGLSFKADIDDLRESPACEIVRKLASEHPGKIYAAEPNITHLPSEIGVFGVKLVDEVGTTSADVLVLLVDHREFKLIDRKLLAGKKIVDTRGIWSKSPE